MKNGHYTISKVGPIVNASKQTPLSDDRKRRKGQIMEMNIPTVTLSNGVEMPQIGFGLFQIRDYNECHRCVTDAIDCGYRLFDTAAAYFNEDALGDAAAEAIEKGKVRREDLFLTTKVWLQDFGKEETRAAVEKSMQNLRTDYLDLVLLHQPFGNWQEAWKTLEQLQREGKIRAIGTSNFNQKKMDQLLAIADVAPQVNQIEIHPFYTETRYTTRLLKQHIQPEAWGPLNEGQRDIFENGTLARIGQAHGKSVAQVALRWNLQKGNVIIPKGTKKEHMKENIDILDFTLSPEEMGSIDAMDRGRSEIIDFDSKATERLLLKLKVHE